jgi:hypothetical protein
MAVLPITPSQEPTKATSLEHARVEKIFIYFSPRTSNSSRSPVPGDWIVDSPRKPVSPGQAVTWQVVKHQLAPFETLELDLPEIFENGPRQAKASSASLSAKVKKELVEPGLHFYEVYVNGQLAIGGSSPAIIIDP